MKPETRNYLLLLFANLSLLLYHTRSFLTAEKLAGRDLIGAYSLVEAFELGWNTQWFLGFPMFQFYPPGFFATVKGLGFITGDPLAFRILVFSTLLIFPVAAYYAFSRIHNQETGLVAGLLAISLIFLREPFSLVYQTLQVGLVAQGAAFLTFILFIGVLWQDSRDSAYLSAVLLGITILLHPFIGTVALLYLLIYLILERNLYGIFTALIGLALSAWWWLPALENTWYMPTYVGPTGQLLNWPWLFLPFLLLNRGRKAVSLSLLGILLLFIGTFDLGVEFQFYRFFIYGQMITVLAAAPGFMKAFNTIEKFDTSSLIVLFGISILLPAATVDIEPHWKSDVDLEGVIPEDGRMIVETSHSDLYNSYVPIQMAPLESNVSVVNGLYADSSISSPYLLGLEKAIAKEPVPNPLAVEAELTEEQLQERMEYFNISYALVRTDHARERLGFMELEAENNDFQLLSWQPEPDREVEAAKVCLTREDWRELNRHIFQNNLTSTPVLDCETGTAISAVDPAGILEETEQLEKDNVEIEDESIRPNDKVEAVFSLEVRNR